MSKDDVGRTAQGDLGLSMDTLAPTTARILAILK